MDWSDIPLLKYESELMIKCGAWSSLYELEDSLILEELFLLYRACANDLSTSIKIAAAAQGADVDFNEDWYEPEEVAPASGNEIRSVPFGLGYEVAKG